MSFDEQKHF